MAKPENVQKALSTLAIIILFIPLVFMGANVFFPDYEDYYPGKNCYATPRPVNAAPGVAETWDKDRQDCMDQERTERQQWEEDRRVYEGQKYIFVSIVCLVAILAALLIPLNPQIKWGLFIGAIVSAFFATLIYFRTKSIIGFLILVILFILVIVFIGRQKIKK